MYPIDFVIPWVDCTDEKWAYEKSKYQKEISSSVHLFDYQEWGLLKYWFRSIEKNAPWVNRIYFITWGHYPKWLNVNHPKLKLVNHTDYIPPEYLPTFSSHTIELNIHRIPGLSEHFVYFNDDTYLLNSTKPKDFFKNSLPCDSAVINPIAPANRDCIAFLQLTTASVINEHFSKHKVIKNAPLKWFNFHYRELLLLNILFMPWGRFPGLLEKHIPSSFLKSTFEEVWEKEYELLDRTCSHRFRNFKTDVNQWIMKEWQIATNTFSPRSIKCGKLLTVSDKKDSITAADFIKHSKTKMVCVNDHIENEKYVEVAKYVLDAFEVKFPEKSEFEI